MSKLRQFTVVLILLFILIACNSKGGQIIITEVAINAPFTTATPSPTSTFTPLPPQADISVKTDCRSGPGAEYDLVTSLNIGDVAIIVGKSNNGDYWIVENPYADGTCWIEIQSANSDERASSVPAIANPPSPTPAPPSAPAEITSTLACNTAGLSWKGNPNNVDGYRVYKGDDLIATTDANTLNYKDVVYILWPRIPGIKYAIEAFNSAGNSSQTGYFFDGFCVSMGIGY
jgi:hypothetical protein